jgi:large subunit ribosomal protein L2
MLLYFNPITPSQRHICLINKKCLERDLFLNSLFCKKYSSFGRNKNGHICTRFRWKGHHKLYRLIDFFYLKGIPYYLDSFEYDPNRSSFINLIFYKNGIYSYILSTMNTYLGS